MSESQPASDDTVLEVAGNPSKKRSPVERAIVWSMIAGLLVIVGIEATAKNGYDSTRTAVQDRISSDPEGDVSYSEVQTLLTGYFSEVQADGPRVGGIATSQYITYRWFSLFKNYELRLTIETGEDDPLVLGFETPEAPTPPVVASEDQQDGDDEAGGFGGPGDGAGFGGGGGGGGFAHNAEEPAGTASGGGGGRSRRGPRRAPGLLGDIQQEWVQSELGMTPEQIEKVTETAETVRPDFSSFREMSPEERAAAFLAVEMEGETGAQKILDEEQFARARELMLQRVGISALTRDDVQAELELTDPQRTQVTELSGELRAALRELGFRATSEARDQAAAPWKALLLEVLTEEQAGRWQAMLGEPAQNRPDPESRPRRPAPDSETE